MTAPVWVVWCEDVECQRTLVAALRRIVPVVAAPPESGPWMLMCEASCLSGKTFEHPPCETLVLGDGDEGGSLPRLERIALPLRLRELATRLRALSSCPAPGPRPLLPGCTLQLDAARRCLVDAATGKTRELTEKETLLLQALITAGDVPLGREALLAEVWAYQPEINTRTLETHLSRLRAKLQYFPDAGVWIATEEGGSRLIPAA